MKILHLLPTYSEKGLVKLVNEGKKKIEMGDETLIKINNKAKELEEERKKAFKKPDRVGVEEYYKVICPYCGNESEPEECPEEEFREISENIGGDDLCDKCKFPISE